MNYQIILPSELLKVIHRAKVVEMADAPSDRIVGFKCDGRLYGFTLTSEALVAFAPQFNLHQTKVTCECCGRLDIETHMVKTEQATKVMLLKTAEGRKSLQKGIA